jgi:DNA-binding GntR family transcriptional regulator
VPGGAPLAEAVTEAIRDAVLDGDLLPGDRIREEAFAEQLGVSRIHLREALRRLAGEGLVVLEPRRGARIAPLRPEEAEEVHALNVALCVSLIEAAMPRLAPADLLRAEAALGTARRASRPAEFLRAIWEFCDTLFAPSGRVRTHRILRELRLSVLGHYRAFAESATERAAVVRRSERLLAACRTGDARRAAALWRASSEQSMRGMRRILADRAGG